MNIEQLLPLTKTGTHEFIDWQLQGLQSNAKYLGLVGGVGSGKTLLGCMLGIILSVQVEANRGIVMRQSYTKLHDSTETTFLEVLGRAGIRGVKYLQHRDNYPHRIILPNKSEIFFRETKDPGRYMGSEYGWYLLDEALEEPERTFTGLNTRLRLPRAGKYLKGIVATNPPPNKSWFAQAFGAKPGMREIFEPTTGEVVRFQLLRSSTRDNPNLPPGYLASLLAGKPDSEIARIVDGYYGFSLEGQPVYPQFRVEKHVRADAFRPKVSVIRGWDFGFHHPAVTWHQLWRCFRHTLHWSVLHEMDASGVEAVDFIGKVLQESLNVFPDTHPYMMLDAGDTAGAQVSDKGPGPIIRGAQAPFYIRIKHRKCPIEPGCELIRRYLSMSCSCGLPVFMVDRDCPSVIEGFLGGYHYLERRSQGRREEPFKDHFFDDFMDSIRYVGENYARLEMKGAGFVDACTAENAGVPVQDPGAWMDGGPWLVREVS